MHKSFFFILFFSLISCFGLIKKSHLDQSWFSKDVAGLFEKAIERYDADIFNPSIILVPHAGHAYSGEVAASSYRLVDSQKIKTIFLIAPIHKAYKGLALPSFHKYKTLYGITSVDTAITKELLKTGLLKQDDVPFGYEHSLEVQLPFLQYHFKEDIKIVPILVGEISCDEAMSIALAIKKYINNSTCFVFTSDFTHYGRQFGYTPFTNKIHENIQKLDLEAAKVLEEYSCSKLKDFINKTRITICGHNPLKILCSFIHMFSQKLYPRYIAYDTSGMQTNSNDHSVSYLAIAYSKNKPEPENYTQQEQNFTLQHAQEGLLSVFDKDLLSTISNMSFLQYPYGTFVTLYKKDKFQNKKLRGCIGRIINQESLYDSLPVIARQAAFNDSRFKPLSKSELPLTNVEVSLLSDPKRIESYKFIKPSIHGIILEQNGRSAVYLPEVLPEHYNNNVLDALIGLYGKAGIVFEGDIRKALEKASIKTFTTLKIV